jgi:hypothetical protein
MDSRALLIWGIRSSATPGTVHEDSTVRQSIVLHPGIPFQFDLLLFSAVMNLESFSQPWTTSRKCKYNPAGFRAAVVAVDDPFRKS